MSITQNLAIIDAFVTDHSFSGNPAGVCLLEDWPLDQWLQGFAAEMNQAETAFLVLGDGKVGLRWFTPTTEVDLCGHATLAAAKYLLDQRSMNQIVFDTKSGDLGANIVGDEIVLDFPSERPWFVDNDSIPIIRKLEHAIWARNRFDVFAFLPDAESVRDFEPDMHEISHVSSRGLVIATETPSVDGKYYCRFFAPQAGVPEDHVTGSVHCALAPFYAKTHNSKKLIGYQLSPRGGIVKTVVKENNRIDLIGKAKPVFYASRLI